MANRPPDMMRPADHLEWSVSLPDYPAADGWMLRYAFLAESSQVLVPDDCGTVTDTGSGEWTVEVTTADTAANFTYLGSTGLRGEYHWQEIIQKEPGPTDRVRDCRTGLLLNLRNLDSAGYSSGLDTRSHAARVLDKIEAVIEGKATKDQLAYSIAGRSLSRMSWGELLRLRAYYRTEHEAELDAERIAQGKGGSALVKARFVEPL